MAKKMKKEKVVKDQINIIAVLVGLLCIFALIAGALIIDNYLENNKDTSSKESSNNNNDKDDDSTSDYDVSSFTKMSATDYLKEIKKDEKETKIAFIGRNTCPACKAFVPTLKKVAEENELEIIYINSDAITSDEYDDLEELFASIGNKFDYIPMLMITKNGKLLDSSSGGKDEDTLITYLKVFGIIK